MASAMKKILLVDDDPVFLEVYRKKLLSAGFQVDIASDGLAAIRLLHFTPPDVVVLDVIVPKFSGLEILKFLQSQKTLKDVRVIILSSMHFGGEQRAAAAIESDKVLAKSDCTPAILLGAINEVLADPKLASQLPGRTTADVDRRLPSDRTRKS